MDTDTQRSVRQLHVPWHRPTDEWMQCIAMAVNAQRKTDGWTASVTRTDNSSRDQQTPALSSPGFQDWHHADSTEWLEAGEETSVCIFFLTIHINMATLAFVPKNARHTSGGRGG